MRRRRLMEGEAGRLADLWLHSGKTREGTECMKTSANPDVDNFIKSLFSFSKEFCWNSVIKSVFRCFFEFWTAAWSSWAIMAWFLCCWDAATWGIRKYRSSCAGSLIQRWFPWYFCRWARACCRPDFPLIGWRGVYCSAVGLHNCRYCSWGSRLLSFLMH